MVTSTSETSPQRHRYGPDPSQFADLHLPAGRRRPGTVVLIHGGWWGPKYGADNLDRVAADLAGRAKLAAGAPGAAPTIHIAGAISLAGVLDLGAAARQKIGNGAATDFMGGAPGERTERYAVADPLPQVPIPAIVRCVHAQADDRVPFAESVTYVAAARAAGQDAQLLEVNGDHFSITDTAAPTWPTVINALEELMGAA